MKTLFRAALAATSLLCALNANATVFSFSYTFGDNSSITGTLQGDAAGSYVTNISDIHVLFNGTAFSGNLVAGGYDAATHQFGPAGTAVLSTDASLNNFIFADAGPTTADLISNYFYFTNDPVNGRDVFAVDYNPADIPVAEDLQSGGAWSLVAQGASEVPEPSSIALTLGALGVLGAVRRRRA